MMNKSSKPNTGFVMLAEVGNSGHHISGMFRAIGHWLKARIDPEQAFRYVVAGMIFSVFLGIVTMAVRYPSMINKTYAVSLSRLFKFIGYGFLELIVIVALVALISHLWSRFTNWYDPRYAQARNYVVVKHEKKAIKRC